MVTRRDFLKAIAPLPLLAVPTASALASTVERTSLTIPIVRLPAEFEGYRITFASDFHLGIWLAQNVFEQALSLIAESKCDLLLLGGDHIGVPELLTRRYFPYVINEEVAGLPFRRAPGLLYEHFARKLIGVGRPPDGIFSVFGNHDRWLAPRACVGALRSANVRQLVNEQITVERGDHRLSVYGLDDFWTGIPRVNFEPAKAANETRILLGHNPDVFSSLVDNPAIQFDLALAGHTHGGQIKVPLFGAPWYNISDRRFGEGLVTVGSKKVLTTRGIGMVELPLRVNCPPEVVVLTLTAE